MSNNKKEDKILLKDFVQDLRWRYDKVEEFSPTLQTLRQKLKKKRERSEEIIEEKKNERIT